MSLADRLNSALARNSLQPVVVPKIAEEASPEVVLPIVARVLGVNAGELVDLPLEHINMALHAQSPTYKTLKEGLKSAHKHSPDEFGTTVIVVESIGRKIQLPMKAGKYIVDDIQKKTDGRYEVHLVSGQR